MNFRRDEYLQKIQPNYRYLLPAERNRILKSTLYQISDKNGIHARPAGVIVQCARRFSSDIALEANGKRADAKKLFSVMQLGVRCGDSVTLTAEGDDEDDAVQELYDTMRNAGL